MCVGCGVKLLQTNDLKMLRWKPTCDWVSLQVWTSATGGKETVQKQDERQAWGQPGGGVMLARRGFRSSGRGFGSSGRGGGPAEQAGGFASALGGVMPIMSQLACRTVDIHVT